jgi:hypothetical protein
MDGQQGPGRRLPPMTLNPSGQATHGGTQAPATATPPPSGKGTWLKNASAAAAKAQGKEYLGHDDPTQILLWQIAYNLTPEQARQASQQGATKIVGRGGTPLDDYEIDELGFGVRGGREHVDQYDPAWGVGAAVRQAVNTASQTRTFAGPDDAQLLGIIQAAAATAGAKLDPEQARQLAHVGYGYTRGTGQASGTDLDDFYDWTAGQATQRVIPAPHQFNPATWDAMPDYDKQLILSAAGRKGYDQADYVNRINKARPQGQAARYASYDRPQLSESVF